MFDVVIPLVPCVFVVGGECSLASHPPFCFVYVLQLVSVSVSAVGVG